MGINISTEEVAIFDGFGAKAVQEQDHILITAGITPEEQDVIIREFLNINGATAALIRIIATLVHTKTKMQTESLCHAEHMSNLLKDKNEIKQLQEQVTLLSNKILVNEQIARGQIEELSNKLQEAITDRNMLQNAYEEEKATMVIREIEYYESKAHYRDLDESDYASSIRNDSDDESMPESIDKRLRSLKISDSLKTKGKKLVGKDEEPMEIEVKDEKGNSLNDLLHATKKKNQHEEKQSIQKHVLGVNCAACGVNKEELMQLIKEDMITCNISYEQIKEIFVNHNNYMTVMVTQLRDANRIMMNNHGREYKYVKLYELNQTIGHTKILLKNMSKHVTREMIIKAIEENIGAVGLLNYKTNNANIDVEVEIEVQIPDRKFRDIWSFACNGYRIEMQQLNADQKEMFRKCRRFIAKIKNLPPNTTDQQLEGKLLPRHAKYWKVYKGRNQFNNDRGGYNNNGGWQFFCTGANRIPINKSRFNNQYGIGRIPYRGDNQSNKDNRSEEDENLRLQALEEVMVDISTIRKSNLKTYEKEEGMKEQTEETGEIENQEKIKNKQKSKKLEKHK
ncbi:hypothetical protein C1645_803040 [Glomus cerebriforme]|uniref:Uncharacterized protein n=1 Tax=Glomus cerebriforme TaxID=658196 RepID=A0A397TG59_9GLOM|nr:hypothetical protein C1645_803040 [Glomus cerebriforme]